MGPSSVWAGEEDAGMRDSTLNGVKSSSNMSTMLVSGGSPEPQRQRLKLLPRSKPPKGNITGGIGELFSIHNIDESDVLSPF